VDSLRLALWGLLIGAVVGAVAGAVWAAFVLLPSHGVFFPERARISLRSIAVSGAGPGGLIGWIWFPRRILIGAAAGAAGGFLFQLLAVVAAGWQNNDGGTPEIALSYGLGAAAIAGLALLVLLVLDRTPLLAGGGERG
jgi:hypothetical protein